MNECENNNLPTHAFWQFSLQIYSEPEVEESLLQLQDRYELNVNVLLFCCWFAKTGLGRIGAKELKLLVDSTRSWHRNIVESLRHIRRKVKGHPKLTHIKKQFLNTEIAAEHIEQLMLVERLLPNPDPLKTPDQRLKDAFNNLQTYTHLTRSIRDCHANPLFVRLLHATFPHIEIETISAIYHLKPTKKVKEPEPEDVQGDLF